MSFAANSSQQASLFDSTSNLTKRESKMLEKSWARYFSERIFPAIDEKPFSVLYSDRPSRHNTPVNVIIGALIIKEMFQLTDEEMVETLPFDIRFQYALHTSSFEEQPLNDRTLGRFRQRCSAYEERTGIDLIHDCISRLSSQMGEMMKLNTGLRRMDSLMVASNIKKMGRLELLYTCVANMARAMKSQKDPAFPTSLSHYTEDGDHNKVLYHNRSGETSAKMEQVLKDMALIICACGSRYDDYSEYQLLIRVLNEQTDKDDDGSLHLKQKKSGMNSEVLQNPADPDATFRSKAGKENRGYVANVVEESNGTDSLTVDYQFEKNNYSDSQFLKDYIQAQPASEGRVVLVTDGGYCGNENSKLADGKNIKLVTTDLKGRGAKNIWADFEFSQDGTALLKCAAGKVPKSSVYNKWDQKCKASFPIDTCKNCPRCSDCGPQFHARVATIKIAQRTSFHAKQQKYLQTDEFKKYARFRNGVETVPAVLRKKHHVDKMPVRGLIKCRQCFGFKIAAMNSRKLIRYLIGQDECALNPQTA